MISLADMVWPCVMQVEVTSRALGQMRAHAAAAHPREACGILLGEGGRITAIRETANVHPAPHTHFEIDPQALIDAHRMARAGGPQVLGYYHSHPSGPPAPSATDRAAAAGDGRVWAIIAGEEVRFWRDGEPGFVALPFCLIDG
jgi:proteasome lid subunit RPN8/RPN11